MALTHRELCQIAYKFLKRNGFKVCFHDVGINTYTSANPNFDSVRGTTKRIDMKNLKMPSLFSTSALLSVGSDHDD